MAETDKDHYSVILDQFSKQAIPFSNIPEHSDKLVFELILKTVNASKYDNVLDVACGPGLMTSAFAKSVKEVTGIDMTPAMIDRAQEIQKKNNIKNIQYDIGDSYSLPYGDDSFSLVVTRYSFHHYLYPENAMAEMKRVCKPGGRIAVIDVSPPPEKQVYYDEVETIRDPSHTKALTPDEFLEIAHSAALKNIKTEFYKLERELEDQIACSFPKEGGADKMREIFSKDLDLNQTGFEPKKIGDEIFIYYPNIIIVGEK